jgi:hypothetical protein
MKKLWNLLLVSFLAVSACSYPTATEKKLHFSLEKCEEFCPPPTLPFVLDSAQHGGFDCGCISLKRLLDATEEAERETKPGAVPQFPTQPPLDL